MTRGSQKYYLRPNGLLESRYAVPLLKKKQVVKINDAYFNSIEVIKKTKTSIVKKNLSVSEFIVESKNNENLQRLFDSLQMLSNNYSNNLFKKIMSQHDVDVMPPRYKQWTNQTFEAWMQSEDFTDTMKDEIKDGSFKFYLQNTSNESRWRTHLIEMAKCAQSDKPMNIIAMTPEPVIDGGEDQLRKEYYNDKENFCKKLDRIFAYKFKHGCYPSQHKDAVLKFAPSTHGEVKDGKLIELGEVLERIAKKEIQEKD